MGSLQVMERDLTIMEREIGGGCFETCYLAKFGARTVVVIQQQNSRQVDKKREWLQDPQD